jgi:Regulator of ribonuclease activity B
MSVYDENAEVLRDMAAAGDDLGKPRPMDFNHLFPTREGAIAFARRVSAEGFTPVVRPYDKRGFPFDVTVTTQAVLPTCDFITTTEQRLATIAAEHEGRPDGWGCMEP